MENKTKWYRDPDVITKIIAVAFLVLLGCCIHFFAQDFFVIWNSISRPNFSIRR